VVSILKDIPIDGVKIIPCRVKGPRGIGDERLILVDTGFSDADADIIMDAIEDMGRKHADLKLCVLTHRHGDHAGGLKKLKKTLKFEVMAHELDMPAIQKSDEALATNIDRMRDQMKMVGASGRIKEKLAVEQVYDFSFVKKAYEEIRASKWDPMRYEYVKR
jgi:glyoxylase-like metal-dependent hydrolase (beta-lactamase superfamily II)